MPFDADAKVRAGRNPCDAPGSDLDPRDWQAFREVAHRVLDDMIGHVATLRSRPVWQSPSPAAQESFARPLPRRPRELGDVVADVAEHVVPFASGNLHPRFMGWAQGAGTPAGIVADMIAAALNLNCGGRHHIGPIVERQVVRWMAEALGFPDDSSGLFLTGSSAANHLAVIVAKVAAIGPATRRRGLYSEASRLVGYASREAHACVAQAFELTGIGSAGLRMVAVDDAGRLDIDALEALVARDRRDGLLPFVVIATAGTVNTGAIDPLADVARIARRERLWLHVDGAIGALAAAFAAPLRPLFAGIELADSVALDFHKWGHVPYDAGFLLVRDAAAHKRAFAGEAAYLQRGERGLCQGETWACDLGPDLSRGFRALKTWMSLTAHGTDRIGDAISSNCELARDLAALIARSSTFELKAPIALNIVCFGLKGLDRGRLNREIVMDVQEAGVAAPSWTTIGGEDVIRCAIFNHRTTRNDIEDVVAALTRCAEVHLQD